MQNFLSYLALVLLLGSEVSLSQTNLWNLNTNFNQATGCGNVNRSVSICGFTGTLNPSYTNWGGVGDIFYIQVNSGWAGGSGSKGWTITVNTKNYSGIRVSSRQASLHQNGSDYGPRDFKLQYSLNNSSWTDVSGATITVLENWPGGCLNSVSLPAECDNKDAVYLRWIMTSNNPTSGSSILGSSAIANILVTGNVIKIPASDITLTNKSVLASIPVGTEIGALSAIDGNPCDTHTYSFSLVSGEGSTNNSLFEITGNKLVTKSALSVASYSVRINANYESYNFAKVFTIESSMEAPTGISLSNTYVQTSSAVGTEIGTFTATDPNSVGLSFTYSLISGEGSTDNSLFRIENNKLIKNAAISGGTYSIRVNVNNGYRDYSRIFNITASFYPPINGDINDYDWIQNVKLNDNINNTTGKDTTVKGYGDYSAKIISLNRGAKFILSVTNGNDATVSEYPEYIKAWIDWNKDGSFDESTESYDIATSVIETNKTVSREITVPLEASLGNLRARVVLRGADEKAKPLMPPSSGSFAYGEAEDYTINVLEALPVELNSFTASSYTASVVLNWRTATEIDNHGFEIQRTSGDCKRDTTSKAPDSEKNWQIIGFVAGNGNSNSPRQYSFTDTPTGGSTFSYRLKQIDNSGAYSYSPEITAFVGIPEKFSMAQNYPNPFNPETTISYQLAAPCFVSLKVYDVLGNEISSLVNIEQIAGTYKVPFNGLSSAKGGHISSGIYFYTIRAGEFVQTKKMILVK